MNKNIRRSIVIAAGVTGAWALASASASADEMPASSLSILDGTTETSGTSQSAPDAGGLLGVVTGTVSDTVTGVVSGVQDTVSGVTGTAGGDAAGSTVPGAQGTADGATRTVGRVTDTAADAAAQARRYVDGTLGVSRAATASGAEAVQGAEAARAAADAGIGVSADASGTVTAGPATGLATGSTAAAAAVSHTGSDSVPDLPQGGVDYLFGPLAAFAPELEKALAAAQTKLNGGRSTVRAAFAAAEAAALRVTNATGGEADTLFDEAAATTTTAATATATASTTAYGAPADVRQYADPVQHAAAAPYATAALYADAAPYAGNAWDTASAVTPLAYGVMGQTDDVTAVGPLAHHAVTTAETLAESALPTYYATTDYAPIDHTATDWTGDYATTDHAPDHATPDHGTGYGSPYSL